MGWTGGVDFCFEMVHFGAYFDYIYVIKFRFVIFFWGG